MVQLQRPFVIRNNCKHLSFCNDLNLLQGFESDYVPRVIAIGSSFLKKCAIRHADGIACRQMLILDNKEEIKTGIWHRIHLKQANRQRFSACGPMVHCGAVLQGPVLVRGPFQVALLHKGLSLR